MDTALRLPTDEQVTATLATARERLEPGTETGGGRRQSGALLRDPGRRPRRAGRRASVDSYVFERFVRDHLAPKLKPGDIVVWDDHSVHKRPELRALIEARGAELVRQPRYSPESNACEPARLGGAGCGRG